MRRSPRLQVVGGFVSLFSQFKPPEQMSQLPGLLTHSQIATGTRELTAIRWERIVAIMKSVSKTAQLRKARGTSALSSPNSFPGL
jgi:hypothetical protein